MSAIFRRSQIAVAAALFALAGASAYAQGPHGHHRGPHGAQFERVIGEVKDKLALDTSQQVLWSNAAASSKAARDSARAERERVHAAVRAEITKPEPDLAAVAALMDQAQANGQAVRHQVQDQWLKLYATFSPAQKLVVRDELVKRLDRLEQFRAKMKERFGRQG